jgi:hypothetical protein
LLALPAAPSTGFGNNGLAAGCWLLALRIA